MLDSEVNLLFVCTANVCRSPLAAGLMAYHAKQTGARVNVASASLDNEIRDIHPTTQHMLERRGVDLGRTVSQPLSDELVNGADLILVMTSEHARILVGRVPVLRPKVFLLSHLAGAVWQHDDAITVGIWLDALRQTKRDYSRSNGWDIQDPIDASPTVYAAVEIQLDNATMWLANVLASLQT